MGGCEDCPYSQRVPITIGNLEAHDYDIVCRCPNYKNGRHLCGYEDRARIDGGQ